MKRQTGITRGVMAIALLLAFALWSPLLTVPAIEDVLVRELGLNHTQTSLLYSGPILMLALVAIPAGFLADRIGIKKAAGTGILLVVLGNLIRGLSNDYSQLLLGTLVYGIGLGWSFPNLPKLIGQCTVQERAYATSGIFTAGILTASGLTLAATVPLIYPITHTYGIVFLFWSIPAFVASIVWWSLIKDPPCEDVRARVRQGVMAFREIFKIRWLWLLAAVLFLHNFFYFSWAGWLPLYMESKGASPGLAGEVTSVTLFAAIPSVIIISRLTFRLKKRKMLLWAPGVALALASWAALYVNISLTWYLTALVGIVSTARFNTIITMPIEAMPANQTGTASGLVMSIGYVGALVGPLLGGMILDYSGSFILLFTVLGVSSIIAVLTALPLPETAPAKDRT